MFGPEEGWIGGGKVMVARHLSRPGYVLYTISIDDGRQGLAESEVTIREIVAPDVATELDLWRYVAGLPWVRTIKWQYAPIDPAALFWLADPRQLRRMAHFDFLWLRPLDMPALVDARDFVADGSVALEVADARYRDLAGRFELRVNGGSGTWSAGGNDAELRLRIADLGEVWLGGSSAAQLLAMGRISGDRAAAHRLDAMLAADGPPRSVTKF
jgi:predicted acetyltransferase